jgi:hypothetical protein
MYKGLRRRSTWAMVFGLAAASGAVLSAQDGYGGPSILSRSQGIMNRPSLTPLRFRISGNFNGLYNNGVGVGTPIGTGDTAGFSGGISAHFIRSTRSSQTTFGYTGGYTYLRGVSAGAGRAPQGMNQHLAINHEHRLSRRWTFFTGHSAGMQNHVLESRRVSQNDGAFQNLFSEPYNSYFEPIDSRMVFYSSGAGLHFQKSRRLTMSFDGGLFGARRSNVTLASARGEQAQGEINYQVSRTQTVGLVYSFHHTLFLRQYGESYVHTPLLSYTRMLSPSWNLYLKGGQYRVEADRLRSVAVDPFIAALVGQAFTIEAVHTVATGVALGAGINGRIKRNQGITISFDRAVNTGNGITLTARSTTGAANYQYLGLRNVSFGLGARWGRLDPILASHVRSPLISYGGQSALTYRLNSFMFATTSINSQRVRYTTTNFSRTIWTATAGISVSPGELPLKW